VIEELTSKGAQGTLMGTTSNGALYDRARRRIERAKRWVSRVSNVHRPNGSPDVFIFAAPRGGSTWLMELIITQPGFKPCNEPFNLRDPRVRAELAARGVHDWPDLYNREKEPALHDYIGEIQSGANGALNPQLHRNRFRVRTSRICFKILHAGEDRIQSFQARFGGRVLVLLRHPIAVSLSRRVLPRLETFLSSDYRRHFRASELALARRIADEGNDLERGVLDWCLQTAVPLRAPDPSWLIVTYEQMVLEPTFLVPMLCKRLALPDPDRMMRTLSVPSASTYPTDEETLRAIARAPSRRFLIEKWLGRVTREDRDRVRAILEAFELDVYDPDEPTPSTRFWLR
jgi:hypothetical protein